MPNNFSILKGSLSNRRVESVVAMSTYCDDNVSWLRQAIESIQNQSYRDFIFVIAIDGTISNVAQDLLVKCAKEDERIVLVKGTLNVGLASCMNYIIELVKPIGPEFFFRMDADDISDEYRLEKQVSYFRHFPDVSILGTGLSEINESGEKVGSRVMPSSHESIVNMLPRRCSMNHPTVALRYSVFDSGITYRPELRNTQDYFLWIALAEAGFKFYNLKDKLLKFRRVNNFYKRRGMSKSLKEFQARFYAMSALHKRTLFNVSYACCVLILRLMPPRVVKLAYKLDRMLLEKFLRH